jgi:hypothetical protein
MSAGSESFPRASAINSSGLPRQVAVAAVASERYPQASPAFRPMDWGARVVGIDHITTRSGEQIKLASSGQQSVPGIGWELVLTGGDASGGYTWTLYSMPRGCTIQTFSHGT